MIVYIDFEDCKGVSREEIRRMIKHLRKNPIFHNAIGRTIYFNVKSENDVRYFLLNLQKILREEGFLTQLILL